MKGAMSQSKDSLGCEYEPMFHFVKREAVITMMQMQCVKSREARMLKMVR